MIREFLVWLGLWIVLLALLLLWAAARAPGQERCGDCDRPRTDCQPAGPGAVRACGNSVRAAACADTCALVAFEQDGPCTAPALRVPAERARACAAFRMTMRGPAGVLRCGELDIDFRSGEA